MKETNKISLGLIGVFLLAVGWYMVFYRGEKNKIEQLKEEIQSVLLKIKATRVSQADLVIIEKKLALMRKEVEQTENKIIPRSQIGIIADGIADLGAQFDLRFVAIVPAFNVFLEKPVQTSREQLAFTKLPVSFRLQGSYQNFGRFLENLSRLPFILAIEEVVIYRNDPLLDIQMRGVVLVRDG